MRQDIDLLGAGFTTNDLDTGAGLDAEAWLRNLSGAGTFDDQVFYRVGCLDGAGQELSAVRCIIAANSTWLQRNLSGLLPVGTRQLRLEIIGKHRRDADNDSMADDLIVRLQKPFPLPTPNITKLPMLQDVRTNAMTLIWETDGNLARHYVDWGRSNVNEHTLKGIGAAHQRWPNEWFPSFIPHPRNPAKSENQTAALGFAAFAGDSNREADGSKGAI